MLYGGEVMSEIKFRAWQKCHFGKIRKIENYCVLNENNRFIGHDLTNDVEGDIFCVEQFTGLCDKNWKEIYAGDILKVRINDNFTNELDFVEDLDGCWQWRDYTVRAIYHESEVIGNIHENPELLEEK